MVPGEFLTIEQLIFVTSGSLNFKIRSLDKNVKASCVKLTF